MSLINWVSMSTRRITVSTCAALGLYTPSPNACTVLRITANGVRSSCAMSANSWRRDSSLRSSVSVI